MRKKSDKPPTQKQIYISLLANNIENKTSLSEKYSLILAAKLLNQFGFNFCAEILQNMRDIHGVRGPYEYIIRIMQSEYIRRNGSQMPNINFGR